MLGRLVCSFTPWHAAAVLVSMHVRRGDSAMARECKSCVSPTEQDVYKKDRFEMQDATIRGYTLQ